MNPASHRPDQLTAEACAECARLSGCISCFEELVRRYESPLLHFLSRCVGSPHDAEDLLQETFLSAYRNLHQYRSRWRFSAWLFTIANRLAISSRRRRRPVIDESGWFDEPACEDSMANPVADAVQREMQGKLWDVVRKVLEPDAFVAVWLNYVESMSAEDIGLVLGRNANAVRILQHRARISLGKHLGPEWKPSGVSL